MPRKINLYQLYDRKAESVASPISGAKNHAPVIREFYRALERQDTTPGQYPQDFQLLKVGEQDEDTGTISAQIPEVIATGEDWVAARNQPSSPSTTRGNGSIVDAARDTASH